MKFILLILTFLFMAQAQATSYSGKISRSSASYRFIEIKSGKSYTITGATPLMSLYLNRLSDGDFVSIEANQGSSSLTMTSLNYVGLNIMLGTWIGNDGYLYVFSSFNDFSITKNIRVGNNETSSYTYIINPSSNGWVILISGTYGSYIGTLRIAGEKQAEMELYDAETGDILRTVNLRK